jgi:regulator of replication initiation timing
VSRRIPRGREDKTAPHEQRRLDERARLIAANAAAVDRAAALTVENEHLRKRVAQLLAASAVKR